jgi:hypothetical protein
LIRKDKTKANNMSKDATPIEFTPMPTYKPPPRLNKYAKFRFDLASIQDQLEELGNYANELAFGKKGKLEKVFHEHSMQELVRIGTRVHQLILFVPKESDPEYPE